MPRVLILLILAVALLAAPAAALAQSAGDEQYTDPFGEGEQGSETQEPAPEPAPEPPVEQQSGVPAQTGSESPDPAPAAEAAQEAAPTLPRTGAPLVLLAATGYALLLAGIAIRRKA